MPNQHPAPVIRARPKSDPTLKIGLAVVALIVVSMIAAMILGSQNPVSKPPQTLRNLDEARANLNIEPLGQWPRLRGDGVRIALPERFDQRDPDSAAALGGIGAVQSGVATVTLFALDDLTTGSGANVTISRVIYDGSVRSYTRGLADLIGGSLTLDESVVYDRPDGQQVGRVVYYNSTLREPIGVVQYVLDAGPDGVWLITCGATWAQFDDWLPIFEQAMETFVAL